MTDTPIYDQLRLELSAGRAAAEGAPSPRQRGDKPPAAQPSAHRVADDSETRRPVSVWTLVNANRKR